MSSQDYAYDGMCHECYYLDVIDREDQLQQDMNIGYVEDDIDAELDDDDFGACVDELLSTFNLGGKADV